MSHQTGLSASDVQWLLLKGRARQASARSGAHDAQGESRAAAQHWNAMRQAQAAFAGRLSAALSQLLRKPLGVKLVGVEAIDAGDFVRGLESPTCLAVVRIGAEDQRMLVEFGSSILFPIIDRLLGGGSDECPVVNRPLTAIEERLAVRLVGVCLTELRLSQSPIDAGLQVEGVESDPRRLRIDEHDTPCALAVFEVTLDQARGPLRLCLPQRLIEHLQTADGNPAGVEPPSELGPTKTGSTNSSTPSTAERNALAQVTLHLAATTVRCEELVGLQPGDIIATAHDAEAPLTVSIDGVPRFHAKPGACQGQKAFQIEKPAAPSPGKRD